MRFIFRGLLAIQQAHESMTKAHLVSLQRFVLHLKVPHFDSEVVPCHQVATVVTELHVRDGRDDFRKKGSSGWILWLLKVYEKRKQKKK